MNTDCKVNKKGDKCIGLRLRLVPWIKRSMPTHFTTVIIHPIWGENRLKTA